jgi:thiamine biosynthesis lipoprotein
MATDRPTRRGFLKGRPAVRELTAGKRQSTELPPAAKAAPSDLEDAPESPLALGRNQLIVSIRRRAMACDWEAQLAAARDDDSMEHVFAALDLVEALEDQMTVYHDDSEVVRINRHAAEHPMPVEPRLFSVLQLAERVYRETEAALDITSGPLSDAWGFTRRRGRVPSDAEISAALEKVGMHHVSLSEAECTIAFDQPGVTINLNSMGKGYALDRMAELLAGAGVDDYLLHGGRSSVLARGNQPGRQQPDGETRRQGDKEKFANQSPSLLVSLSPCLSRVWPVGLRHPLRPTQRLCEFYLRDESLSTSGAGTQFFRRRGRRYGHILDPRTGRPAEGIYSATVVAPTAVEAEALSTAFYVMGPDKVADYCRTRPDVAALLVTPAEREGEIRLHALNLDDSRWRQLDQQ